MGHMRKSRLSQHKQVRLIEHFVAGSGPAFQDRFAAWLRYIWFLFMPLFVFVVA